MDLRAGCTKLFCAAEMLRGLRAYAGTAYFHRVPIGGEREHLRERVVILSS